MSYDSFVAEVKKQFSEMKKVSKQEIENYFAEKETKEQLIDAYRASLKAPQMINPVSVASDLSMMW